VHIGIVFLLITVVSGETLLGVGNVKSTIRGTLEGAEDAASGGGSTTSNIEKGTEGTLVIIYLIDVVGLLSNLSGDNLGIDLGVSLIDFIEADLLEETTGDEKSSTVSSCVVLVSTLKSVTGEFTGGGLGEDTISVNEGVDDLADDDLVGETDDETVLGGLVLVLRLAHETLALTVVGASFTATTELDLESAEVCLALLNP